MSYIFHPDRFYRMPTHFGPSLGPRQGIDNRRYANLESSKDLTIQATFEANACQLEKLLPPGFSLRESHTLCLTFGYGKGVEWLAGRGYNTFGISCPVTYNGQRDTVHGELLLVLWENMADPIITGREDLGFSKVYCELPEPQFIDNRVICRASWDGCEFANLNLTGLREVPAKDLPKSIPSDGKLHYRYFPKPSAPGKADIEYVTLTPASWPNIQIEKSLVAASADAYFRHSTWEELPTLVHIVNSLSELTLGNCISAILVKSHGGKDLSDQRILE